MKYKNSKVFIKSLILATSVLFTSNILMAEATEVKQEDAIQKTYNDFEENQYWTNDMLWAMDKGLISGYLNSKHPVTGKLGNWLNPYGNLTEGQLLTILFRYKSPDELNNTKAESNFWASVPYQLAKKYKLPVKGSLTNQSPAGKAVTRGTMAKVIASLYFGKEVTEEQAINFMYQGKLSNGYKDKNGNYPMTVESFGSKDPLKRAHIVTFIKHYDDLIQSGDKINYEDIIQLKDTLLYDAILNALLKAESVLDYSRFTQDFNEVYDTVYEVLKDHPEIIYFKSIPLGTDSSVGFNYSYPKSEIIEMNNKLEKLTDEIIAEQIQPGMNEFEKVKAIHDYVVLNSAYDYENYKNNTIPKLSYTVYGLLVNGTAVCDGYAKTMFYLLNKIGIETLYVVGKGHGEDHAWNKVKIDGLWYNLDATWDDPVPNLEGYVRYKYFLISDSKLREDHIWDNSELPDASNSTYSYIPEFFSPSDLFGDKNRNIVLHEGYFYFINQTNIFKMKTDGTNKKSLLSVKNGYLSNFVINEGWIYSLTSEDNGPKYITKMKTDGSDKQTIYSIEKGTISKFSINEDWLLIVTSNGLIKMKSDGTSKELYENVQAYNVILYNQGIYYNDLSNNRQLTRINMDGTNKQMLGDIAMDFVIYEDWIYYLGESYHLFKIKLDGTQKTKLTNFNTENLRLSGSTLFYMETYPEFKMHRLELE
ncbi:DUF5050 domain-containing protein [Neobacillus sp. D3-1R]|uniref:DUF5050 domain-containing protein n=1 Tax=Neobacillus sp. D3-1R TaxID=3445778 RepID=UPI003FA107B2